MQAGSRTQNPNRLTTYIMVSLLLGIAVGYACNTLASPQQAKVIAGYFSIVADIFLRMIKMIIAPLVFATIVSGISSLGASGGAVGRIAGKALAWFITASVISLLVGLLLANVLQPGHGLGLTLPEANAATNVQTGSLNIKDFAAHVFPISVVQAMAGNEVLQILVFSMFFGFALSAVKATLAPDIAKSIDQIVPVMLKFTDYVMRFAPAGVFSNGRGDHHAGRRCPRYLRKVCHALYFGLAVLWSSLSSPAASFWAGPSNPASPASAADDDRLLDLEQRGGLPEDDRAADEIRRLGTHHRLRAAARLLVQSRRLDDVSDICGAIRRPGLRHRDAHYDPNRHAASVDGDQQGHRRCTARIPGRSCGAVPTFGLPAGGLVLLMASTPFWIWDGR